ncbi:uncharacterized protein [Miscanthus floridulus]|uniref:uncharacterized protein n=1 Tax=Miscanthus floridulus TaxID=154761 RepID=UPI0034585B90
MDDGDERPGLQDEDDCALCSQEPESADHLTEISVFAREAWFRVLAPLGLAQLALQQGTSITGWWLSSRARLRAQLRKGFDSLLILGAWCLWKERNRRVFDGISQTPVVVASMIEEEADKWSQAGYPSLAELWGWAMN